MQQAGSKSRASTTTLSLALLLLAAGVLAVCGAGAGRGLKLENGEPASTREHAWIAQVLRSSDRRYACVGSLVHPRMVLTAAHCVVPLLDGQPNPTVVLGQDIGASAATGVRAAALLRSGSSAHEETFTTTSHVHPAFVVGSFDFDVAALVLDRPAAAAPVAMVDVGSSPPPKGAQMLVLGWGATHLGTLAPSLQEAQVTQVPMAQCDQAFAPYGSHTSRRMLCVTGRTCAGDSGGPLLLLGGGGGSEEQQPRLAGTVSFGLPRQQGAGCPVPNPVTAYTDLASPRIRAWLQQVIIDRVVLGKAPAGGSAAPAAAVAAQARGAAQMAAGRSRASGGAQQQRREPMVADDPAWAEYDAGDLGYDDGAP